MGRDLFLFCARHSQGKQTLDKSHVSDVAVTNSDSIALAVHDVGDHDPAWLVRVRTMAESQGILPVVDENDSFPVRLLLLFGVAQCFQRN